MGIHLMVVDRATGKEATQAEWDWLRMGGDRDLMRAIGAAPDTISEWDAHSEDWLYRPNAPEAWDGILAAAEYQERARQLRDLLVARPTYWLRPSY